MNQQWLHNSSVRVAAWVCWLLAGLAFLPLNSRCEGAFVVTRARGSCELRLNHSDQIFERTCHGPEDRVAFNHRDKAGPAIPGPAAPASPASAAAQSARSSAETDKKDQAFEKESLRISNSNAHGTAAKSNNDATVESSASDLSRIFIALIVVIALILLLRGLYRHLTSPAGIGRAAKLVNVLSRSMISPRQQVLVLQVGKRLLIVGDSAGRMSPLCEITDPDEVATMVGQARQTRSISTNSPFSKIFRGVNEKFDQNDFAHEPDSELETVGKEQSTSDINPDEGISTEEVGGLLNKVRMLQQQFGESRPALLPSPQK